MVVVAIVVVIVVGVAVVKVLAWPESIINIFAVFEVLIIDVLAVLADVEIIVVGAIVIVVKFVLPVSYSVNVSSSGVTVGLFMDALAGSMLGVLTGIGVEVLSDVSTNAFAVVITALEFPVSTPLEEFSR